MTAAQTGDRRALDELVSSSVPLVYTIVRRALSGDPDADDVVQDTLLRAVRQLPALQHPESFRPWLAAIAVHQVSTHLHRRAAAAQRATTLDEAAEVPDADAEFEDLTMLRLELSAQRHQVTHASRWLDPDDRALLSLWWLEVAGELTRAELAEALQVSVAHAGVRLQRMRQQLDAGRALVAALQARPRCPVLDGMVADWDGVPSPLWRKRLTRHTRDCPVCGQAAHGLIAAERLLVGFALLPVPIGLAAALLGKTAPAAAALAGTIGATGGASGVAGGVTGGLAASGNVGLIGQLVQALAAHPVAATIAAGTLVAGAAVTVTTLPSSPPEPRTGIAAAPTPSAPSPAQRASAPAVTVTTPAAATTSAAPSTPATVAFAPGRSVSLESAAQPGGYVTTADGLGVLAPLGPASAEAARRQATFAVVTGLADGACYTFRAQNGQFLRHASWRFRLDADQGTALFRGDATFCVKPGTAADTIRLEASNYPGWFLHPRGNGQLWVDQTDNSPAFAAGTSFRARPALAG
ncbi:sigma-70 family RNA polymerase sigma factor [Dactylosporangium sp. NPDC050688]|uniref:sigma-70 family RNA polymerase sigma factor n=1 Tax=Dactylosporangium sp. NPDC050688 TaxID=3157217 RepID=UPI0033FAD6E4